MNEVRRAGGMVWIGNFLGNLKDSPSGCFSIAFGGLTNKTSSLEDRHYKLISGTVVVSSGKLKNRIFTATVADDGHFAVETITPDKNSHLVALTPNGDICFEKEIQSNLQLFRVLPGGQFIYLIADNHLQVYSVTNPDPITVIEIPNRLYPNDARYSIGSEFVEVHQPQLGWYRFSLDGVFVDEERWINDYMETCDGTVLYHVVREYFDKNSSPTKEELVTYALWIEEALNRGLEEGFMFTLSNVYSFLADMWAAAEEPKKAQNARNLAEEHLDGFRLVDRANNQRSKIGNPPDIELANQILADLDRAETTERLFEYPNYIGKLYRTKGEVFEALGRCAEAVESYRKALNANPKAGCLKKLKRLTGTTYKTPKKKNPD